MKSGTDQVIEATKQELSRLKDFLISPFLKLALLSNHLTHKQPHKLSDTHETRPVKPPAARCVNVQGSARPRGSAQQSLCVGWEEQSWTNLLCTFRTSFVLRAGSQFSPRAEQCLFSSTGKTSGHLCYWGFSGSTFSSNNSQFRKRIS